MAKTERLISNKEKTEALKAIIAGYGKALPEVVKTGKSVAKIVAVKK